MCNVNRDAWFGAFESLLSKIIDKSSSRLSNQYGKNKASSFDVSKSPGPAILKDCAIASVPSVKLLYSPCISNTIILVYFNLLAFSNIFATHQLFPDPVLPKTAACRWKNLLPSSTASALVSIIKEPIFNRLSVSISFPKIFIKFWRFWPIIS